MRSGGRNRYVGEVFVNSRSYIGFPYGESQRESEKYKILTQFEEKENDSHVDHVVRFMNPKNIRIIQFQNFQLSSGTGKNK